MTLHERIEALAGRPIEKLTPLSAGMIAQVYRVQCATAPDLVVKLSPDRSARLDIEGRMLRYLREHSQLPVPQVIHSDPDLLLVTYIDNRGRLNPKAEADAAQHITRLHTITADRFGLPFDTLIGPLHQPNGQTERWIPFFREQRLRYMADVAYQSGHLPQQLRGQIDHLLPKLDDLLLEPVQPSLLHGDLWAGNILVNDERIAGFVDPALYYGHAEIELAFSTLFGTFGPHFFEAYQTLRPIEPGFFEVRRDLYNLYPLLVHVALFGSAYLPPIQATLQRHLDR